MGNLGFGEMLVIAVVVLLVFGPGKLPEIGKSLGKGIAEFKKAFSDAESGVESKEDPQPPNSEDKPNHE